jgi:hypothetical protein
MLAVMIPTGIGLDLFSERMASGQSAAHWLATVFTLGFGLHRAGCIPTLACVSHQSSYANRPTVRIIRHAGQLTSSAVSAGRMSIAIE